MHTLQVIPVIFSPLKKKKKRKQLVIAKVVE